VLKFSSCGKLLLCATLDNLVVILDAFEGNELNRFTNFQNENSIIECSLTPDSRYVVSGSESGVVHVWSLNPSEKIIELTGHI
jgi:COMPASS component SWD2